MGDYVNGVTTAEIEELADAAYRQACKATTAARRALDRAEHNDVVWSAGGTKPGLKAALDTAKQTVVEAIAMEALARELANQARTAARFAGPVG